MENGFQSRIKNRSTSYIRTRKSVQPVLALHLDKGNRAWCRPITLATREAEAREYKLKASLRYSEIRVSPWNLERPYLKTQTIKRAGCYQQGGALSHHAPGP